MRSATGRRWRCRCTHIGRPSSSSNVTFCSCRPPMTGPGSGNRSPIFGPGWIRTESQADATLRLAALAQGRLSDRHLSAHLIRFADTVITGFNTDIKHNEKVFHVQTEDKGVGNPYIESLVYVGGEILASKKTSYAEQLKGGIDEKWIGGLMEQQHRTMIAAIKRGRFDGPAETTRATERPTATLAQGQGASARNIAPIDDEKTLDQVVIDYLASEA